MTEDHLEAAPLEGHLKAETLTRRTIGGFSWQAVGSTAEATLKILVLVVLARLLLPADFGVVGAALVVVAFTQVFAQVGVGPALIQRQDLQDRHIRTAFSFSLMSGIGAAIAIFLLSPLIGAMFQMPSLVPVVRLLALVFPITALGLVAESLLYRNFGFRRTAIIDVLSYGLGYGLVGIGAAAAGFGKWSLALGVIAQACVRTALLLWLSPHSKNMGIDRRSLGDLMGFGLGYAVAEIGNFAANQVDNIVVGRFLGPAALGLYGRAFQYLMLPVNLIGRATDKVLFPAMTKVQNEPARLARGYMRALGAVTLVTLPLSLVLIVAAPEIVLVLLGAKWSATVTPFRFLAASMLFRTSYKISESVARAAGAVAARAWRQWTFAALVTSGALLGLPGGLAGVSAGVAIAIFCMFLLMLGLSRRLIGLSWLKLAGLHLRHALCSLPIVLAAYAAAAVGRSLQLPPIGTLGLLTVSAGVTFIAIFLWGSHLYGEEGVWMRSMLDGLLGRIFRRSEKKGEAMPPGPNVARPRIVFLINSLAGGGAERVMTTLLAHSGEQLANHDVTLVLLDQEKEAYQVPDGVSVVRLDCKKRLLNSIVSYWKLHRTIRPRVTLSFLTRSNHVNVIVARLSGGRAVISERANTTAHYGSNLRGRIGAALVRLTYPRADHVVAVSEDIRQDLIRNFGVKAPRCTTLYNPVDIDAIVRRACAPAAQALEKPFIMGMGRLVEGKNFALLIRAVARSAFPGRLVIVGEGPERQRLAEVASAEGISERFELVGFLDNPHALLSQAEFFVLSSNSEGFPNSVVEAMALGVPVVATNCASGPSEIVANMPRPVLTSPMLADYGILVPPNDDVSLASAIAQMGEIETRERYSAAALTRAAEFSADKAVVQYWALLSRFL